MGMRRFASRLALGQRVGVDVERFPPYPGFAADPYKEYSEPWFGTHKVLRGASFSTPRRLARRTFRNFYQPHRGDVFCGFRTCQQ